METTAQTIAAKFDGTEFTTADGEHFDEVCKGVGGVRFGCAEIYKYEFQDGSVLTVAGDAWDFGYEECMCWQGAGHDPDNCTAIEREV